MQPSSIFYQHFYPWASNLKERGQRTIRGGPRAGSHPQQLHHYFRIVIFYGVVKRRFPIFALSINMQPKLHKKSNNLSLIILNRIGQNSSSFSIDLVGKILILFYEILNHWNISCFYQFEEGIGTFQFKRISRFPQHSIHLIVRNTVQF